MAKSKNFKKPVNNEENIIDEEEKNKRLIIIVCLSIVVVIGLIIASICYFNSNTIEDDDKKNNNDDKKQEEVIKDPVVEEKPVVEEHKPEIIVDNVKDVNSNDNEQIADNTSNNGEDNKEPEEEVKPTPNIASENLDYQVTVDESGYVAKLTGKSKFYAKVNEAFGEGYNNIIKVKVTLNKDYKLEDLTDKLTISTRTINGWNNYDVNVLDSTDEEKEAGNLYFYWMQAVGKGMTKEPTLIIDYGNGFKEEYTMDLSKLVVEALEEDTEKTLVALNDENTQDEKIVIGGQEIKYQMYVLEDKTMEEIWEETQENSDTVVASEEASDNQTQDGTTPGTDENGTPDLEEKPDAPIEPVVKPENKDYTLKFAGIANYYKDGVQVSGTTIDSNYVLSVKLIAPTETLKNPVSGETLKDSDGKELKQVIDYSNMVLTITNQEGVTIKYVLSADGKSLVEKEDPTKALTTVEVKNGYINFYQVIDEEMAVNPIITVDWDGEDGNAYGESTYKFDISELVLEEDPTIPVPGEDDGKDNENVNDGEDGENNQSGDSTLKTPEAQTDANLELANQNNINEGVKQASFSLG